MPAPAEEDVPPSAPESFAAAPSPSQSGGTPLEDLEGLGIGAVKIRRLMEGGIDTVEALAEVDVKDPAMVRLASTNKQANEAREVLVKWRDFAQTFLARIQSCGHLKRCKNLGRLIVRGERRGFRRPSAARFRGVADREQLVEEARAAGLEFRHCETCNDPVTVGFASTFYCRRRRMRMSAMSIGSRDGGRLCKRCYDRKTDTTDLAKQNSRRMRKLATEMQAKLIAAESSDDEEQPEDQATQPAEGAAPTAQRDDIAGAGGDGAVAGRGDDGASKRRRKDPGAPKGRRSAYVFFCDAKRAEVKEQHPDYSFGDISRALGPRWTALPDDDKAPYVALATADAKRHDREMAAYQDRLQPITMKTRSMPVGSSLPTVEQSVAKERKRKRRERAAVQLTRVLQSTGAVADAAEEFKAQVKKTRGAARKAAE